MAVHKDKESACELLTRRNKINVHCFLSGRDGGGRRVRGRLGAVAVSAEKKKRTPNLQPDNKYSHNIVFSRQKLFLGGFKLQSLCPHSLTLMTN